MSNNLDERRWSKVASWTATIVLYLVIGTIAVAIFSVTKEYLLEKSIDCVEINLELVLAQRCMENAGCALTLEEYRQYDETLATAKQHCEEIWISHEVQ